MDFSHKAVEIGGVVASRCSKCGRGHDECTEVRHVDAVKTLCPRCLRNLMTSIDLGACAERFTALRGYDAEGLAEKAGMPVEVVRSFFEGKHDDVMLDDVAEMAKAIGCDVWELCRTSE